MKTAKKSHVGAALATMLFVGVNKKENNDSHVRIVDCFSLGITLE